MPSKIRPDDWDRLFAPNAPRRGGPLRVLLNLMLVVLILGLFGAGAVFARNFSQELTASRIATVTAVAPTIYALQTTTREAQLQRTATREAQSGATIIAQQTLVPAGIGVGVATSGGNLRSEPRVVPETVLGQIASGAQVTFLEERLVGGETWFRVRLATASGTLAAGAEGWASATLLSRPTPVPTLTPTPTPAQ
ncbi:MAG: SH3 domain-containing protein [Blastochloris sp.]|nr:SH3 domain-containing protein [Blastochloris sp.]